MCRHLPAQTQTPGGGRSGHIRSSALPGSLTKQHSGQAACWGAGRPATGLAQMSQAASSSPRALPIERETGSHSKRGTGFWWQRSDPPPSPFTQSEGLRGPERAAGPANTERNALLAFDRQDCQVSRRRCPWGRVINNNRKFQTQHKPRPDSTQRLPWTHVPGVGNLRASGHPLRSGEGTHLRHGQVESF